MVLVVVPLLENLSQKLLLLVTGCLVIVVDIITIVVLVQVLLTILAMVLMLIVVIDPEIMVMHDKGENQVFTVTTVIIEDIQRSLAISFMDILIRKKDIFLMLTVLLEDISFLKM